MILNDNSTQQINTLVIQLQNKITNLTNEFRKLNNNIDDLNSEISDLEKRISSNENDADNNIGDLDSKISDLEKRVSSNENEAAAMNTEISANTEAISGKADKIHTHTKSDITDFPTSLPANGGTADSAKKLKPFASWNDPYVYDATNGTRYFVFKIQMVGWFNSILIQIYSDINYALSRKYILGLWHNIDVWGYNVSVTDLGGTISNALRVWLGNDGNVYLQTRCEWTSRISFSSLEDASDITVEKIGSSRLGSNKDIDGNVLFTPLTDPIIDCGAIRGASDLSSASKEIQHLKADEFTCSTGTFTENITAPNITNLEQRVAALESKA